MNRRATFVDWLEPGGAVAAHLAGFEVRPQQREMAEAVAAAFADERCLIVEAGTGVGKTFAYLLPAIQLALEQRARVVVSTHTIALQEQLFRKDIPFLLNALGVELPVELVKGRNNYLSLRRLKGASEKAQSLLPALPQREALHAVEDWAYQTEDGSLSDLASTPPHDVWEKVRSEHNNCLGRRCPTYQQCFYYRARRRADQAALLVVNHALLIADLVLRRAGANVLPDHDHVVIDEAHTLEGVAAGQFGLTVSSVQVQHALAGLYNERTNRGLLAALGDQAHRHGAARAAAVAATFFGSIQAWARSHGRSNGRLVAPPPVRNDLSPALRELSSSLTALQGQQPREEDRIELAAAIDRTNETAQQLEAVLEQQYPEHVYWLENDADRGPRVLLRAAPLDVAPVLKAELFERRKSVVLTSATLATGAGDFSYLAARVGLTDPATLQLGSPFDFQSQARVVVEAGLPDPSDNAAFTAAAARATVHHVRVGEGRAFVLFTSYRMLSAVGALLREELDAEGYTLLLQGEALPPGQMLAVFRSTPRAVILGVDSFWQGVDVVGEALSRVIIVKLPFAVPDRPDIEARCDLIRRRGGDPFRDFQIPEAVLKFRQGFGRLIRSKTDRGVVVVLDPRVVRKAYGKRFLGSLPPAPVHVEERRW